MFAAVALYFALNNAAPVPVSGLSYDADGATTVNGATYRQPYVRWVFDGSVPILAITTDRIFAGGFQ